MLFFTWCKQPFSSLRAPHGVFQVFLCLFFFWISSSSSRSSSKNIKMLFAFRLWHRSNFRGKINKAVLRTNKVASRSKSCEAVTSPLQIATQCCRQRCETSCRKCCIVWHGLSFSLPPAGFFSGASTLLVLIRLWKPELLFLPCFPSLFGSCPFSLGSQALFSFLGTFVGLWHLVTCSWAHEALFTLLAGCICGMDHSIVFWYYWFWSVRFENVSFKVFCVLHFQLCFDTLWICFV